ncbi:hypothetical protein CBL_01425 [Carabus blaptoides fortunei]
MIRLTRCDVKASTRRYRRVQWREKRTWEGWWRGVVETECECISVENNKTTSTRQGLVHCSALNASVRANGLSVRFNSKIECRIENNGSENGKQERTRSTTVAAAEVHDIHGNVADKTHAVCLVVVLCYLYASRPTTTQQLKNETHFLTRPTCTPFSVSSDSVSRDVPG